MKKLLFVLIALTMILVACGDKEEKTVSFPESNSKVSNNSRITYEDRFYPYVEFFTSIEYDDSEITEGFTGNYIVESGKLDRDGDNYKLTLVMSKKAVVEENGVYDGFAEEDSIYDDYVEYYYEEDDSENNYGDNPGEIDILLYPDDIIQIKNTENERFSITVEDFYQKVQRGVVETDPVAAGFEYNFEGIGDCVDKNDNLINAISFEDDKIVINFNKVED